MHPKTQHPGGGNKLPVSHLLMLIKYSINIDETIKIAKVQPAMELK